MAAKPPSNEQTARLELPGRRYLPGLLGVAAITLLLSVAEHLRHLANVSMLYLLVVIAVAVGQGRGPAVVTALAAFLAFDWFSVDPRYQLAVSDASEWIALLLFLVTAVVIGQLTGRLQAEAEAARRREAETAALAEASWAVASQVDLDHALAEVLRRVSEVAGAAAAVFVADASGELVALARVGEERRPSPAAPADELLSFVLREGWPVAWGGTQHWQRPGGPAVPPGVAYLPLVSQGQVLGVLYLDVGPDRLLAASERRVVDSLANHAGIALHRERLVQRDAEARAVVEADRLKTALLSMVSHDFRSPLASVKASVTGLLSDGEPLDVATQQELLRGVDHEVDRLNGMVENVLALSRLESGAWRPQLEATPVDELLGAALDGFSSQANERIGVTRRGVAEVVVDPVQIVQVLRNLLQNALRYSPDGSPVELVIQAERRRLLFEVLDRGPGLPPGEEQRVFEPFYRAQHLRESALSGVGLGLAVCRGLVEAHGGRLTAANRNGGGAVFRGDVPSNWEEVT